MKKFLTSAIVLFWLAMLPAAGQVQFGIKGGLNNTNMNICHENLKNRSNYGWFIGPTLKAMFPLGPVKLGGDISALYDQRQAKIEYDGTDQTIRQKSILVPVNVRAGLSLLKVIGLYVATGPQFGFNVGKNDVDLGSASSVSSHFQLRKSQFSWNFGGGITVMRHFEVGATYCLGIAKTGELKGMTEQDIRDTPKQKSWTVSLAYYF